MSVQDIAKLGKLLAQFLAGFACCFARPAGRALLQIYVKGLLSDVQRKNAEAIGCIDETGTAKSGRETAGVKRQYNGNRGKIENCSNNVALAYSVPGFDCLLDARLYLPCEWTDDSTRRKKTTFLMRLFSRRSLRLRWT